jgi:hypothetical protein
MGKTTLLFHFLDGIRYSARSVFIFDTQCEPRELIGYILRVMVQTQENRPRTSSSEVAIGFREAADCAVGAGTWSERRRGSPGTRRERQPGVQVVAGI